MTSNSFRPNGRPGKALGLGIPGAAPLQSEHLGDFLTQLESQRKDGADGAGDVADGAGDEWGYRSLETFVGCPPWNHRKIGPRWQW